MTDEIDIKLMTHLLAFPFATSLSLVLPSMAFLSTHMDITENKTNGSPARRNSWVDVGPAEEEDEK
jgi:hypothetical protein